MKLIEFLVLVFLFWFFCFGLICFWLFCFSLVFFDQVEEYLAWVRTFGVFGPGFQILPLAGFGTHTSTLGRRIVPVCVSTEYYKNDYKINVFG